MTSNKPQRFSILFWIAHLFVAVVIVTPLTPQASERATTVRVNAIDISSLALQTGLGGHNIAAVKDISTLIIGGKKTLIYFLCSAQSGLNLPEEPPTHRLPIWLLYV